MDGEMTFTKFKDRIWGGYDRAARTLAAAPEPMSRAAFASIGSVLWGAYAIPGTPVRRSFRALSRLTAAGTPRQILRGFSRGLTTGLYRMELLRLGREQDLDRLFVIPDEARLDGLLAQGGVLMLMPHAHASLLMVRAFAQRVPVLLLARATRDDARAACQMSYYARLGCDVLDVRRESEARVARAVLAQLSRGHVVIGAGDLIRHPPRGGIDRKKDLVRTTAFGEPVGAAGWPTRFAAKAGVPLLPVMAEQGDDAITVHLGSAIAASGPDATALWMTEQERLLRTYPADWTFALDRHWTGVLDRAASRVAPAAAD